MASDPLAMLDWLVESGADEAIAASPVNRLAAGVPLPAVVMPPQPPPAARPAPARPAAMPAASLIPEDAIGTAQNLAAAATNLAQLRAVMESFEGCALKRGATNTVFADGTELAPVMLIGEAPGREEDRIGKPFVGRAGQLLDKMLASIGLDRARNAYITNVINWRPPDNRDPTPEEAAQCLPFLRRHIELAQPKVIILLGAVAARHVVGKTDGIMKIRGRWMDYRVGDQLVPLMPTLHPAYLLRQPAHKKLAWRDLQAVRDRLAAPG